MDRLSFLKTMGLAAFAPLATWLPQGPRELSAGSEDLPKVQFRGAPGGRIQASRDAGKTWEWHTHLGEDYSVRGFVYSKDQVQARIAHEGRPFSLHLSPDGRHWRTDPA